MAEELTLDGQIMKLESEAFRMLKARDLVNARLAAILKDLEDLQALQAQQVGLKVVKSEGEAGNE